MIPGVLCTRVGYAGGTVDNPTYRKLGDYTECIEMDFDPNQVSFEQLLDLFWQAHSPFSPPYSRQYRSLILYHNSEQERMAKASKAALEENDAAMPRNQMKQLLLHSRLRGHVYTEIEPFKEFYLAEGYHQKYYLRRADQIMAEVESRFPSVEQLVASKEVARLNGYVSGHGTQAQLEKEISDFGLSPAAQRRLRQIVEGFGR